MSESVHGQRIFDSCPLAFYIETTSQRHALIFRTSLSAHFLVRNLYMYNICKAALKTNAKPIALFRTTFRIYAKYRPHIVKQWAAILPDSKCNTSSGNWVGDSTWRMQIRAITSTAKKSIEFLMDVRKALDGACAKRATYC